MEEVGSSPSSDVCDPPADKELEIGKVYMLPKYSVVFCICLFPNHFSCVHFLPLSLSQHCIRLTKEQYTTLRELRDDPLFKKAILTRLSYPSWEKLMTGKTSSKGFTWIVYHYWLGSLKFALQSRCVEGGEKLYAEIFTVYNELLSVSKPDDAYHVFCPPRKRKLVFEHVGEGVFRLRLEGYNPAEEQPQPKTTSHTEEACQRRVRVLSAEAMHVTRGSPWPKMCRSLHFHVAGLPYSVLDMDGVGVRRFMTLRMQLAEALIVYSRSVSI